MIFRLLQKFSKIILGMFLTEFVKDRVCEDEENCIIDSIFK